jgi:hypothetical protein
VGTPEFEPFPFQTFDGQYWTILETQRGLAYTLTGVVLVNFKGSGPEIKRTNLHFSVDIRELPEGQGLRLSYWAPFATLNAMSNDDIAKDALWAVDTFKLTDPRRVMRTVELDCGLATRDIDGRVLRVGYAIHLVGSLAPFTPVHPG